MKGAAVAFSLLAAGDNGPAHLLTALVPLLLILVAFDIYCLIDLFRSRQARYLPKIVWAIIIVVISAPIGGLAYLFLGKNHRPSSPQAR